MADLELISPIFASMQGLLPQSSRTDSITSIIRASQSLMTPMIIAAKRFSDLLSLDFESSMFGPEPIVGVPLFRFDLVDACGMYVR